eukprot:9029423-Ditylum_brightwellii.AAC.1
MSMEQNFAWSVDMTSLNNILVTSISAVGVHDQGVWCAMQWEIWSQCVRHPLGVGMYVGAVFGGGIVSVGRIRGVWHPCIAMGLFVVNILD